MLENKTILFFGGTGSLGKHFNSRFLDTNKIYNFSRDECKHWEMKIMFNYHTNLNFIIGDIINRNRVEETILRVKPNIIIIGSAMKHIDQCENNTEQSLNTNLLGTKNILDSIEKNKELLKNSLETVLFVSSDKACSPINVYGMCKALSETLIIEKAHYLSEFKFVNIRYGNVLNSSGSIIPTLHKIGNDSNKQHFSITHEEMTRFVMTLDDSVDLIVYAIINGESGDTVIPKLISMNIIDLVELFSEKYNKPIKNIGLKPGEKLLESLINVTQSERIIKHDDYYHIKSVLKYPNFITNNNINDRHDYNSKINPLKKYELKEFLIKLNLL